MSDNNMAIQPDIDKDASQALIDAFFKGAGINNNPIGFGPGSKLTPELMEMLGKLLATSIHGTHDLLTSRAVAKRKVSADVTIVVNRNNNPLKFLQDGDTILLHMLRKKMPGFMDPIESMQEAFSDLHTHQSAILAGVQAALNDTMQRFDPKHTEAQVPQSGGWENWFPSLRKAKLWDKQVEEFDKIQQEGLHVGQPYLGNAFLNAYEKEVQSREDAYGNG